MRGKICFMLFSSLFIVLPSTTIAIPVTGGCGDSSTALGVLTVGGQFYVVEGDGGIWLYAESNDRAGLQRGNAESAIVPGDAQHCYDEPSGDALLL